MRLPMWAAGGVLGLASACSGSSSDSVASEQDAYDALAAEELALRETVILLDQTSVADVPVSGSATYQGVAVMSFDSDPRGPGLIGEAQITADFERDVLQGELDGFVGAVAGDDISSFDGVLSISNGRIDATQDQPLTADVNGRLTSGDDVIVVDTALAGELRGDPRLIGEAPEAMVLESPAGTTFTVNGSQSAGGIEVIAVD